MRVVAIVQARMGSTRLPGKVLMNLGGRTTLARVVRRLRRCARVDQLVVATTDSSLDDPIIEECLRLEADVFRGSEHDVLDRYYHAAQMFSAGIIVRITSDCPLIDPDLVDQTIFALVSQHADYASNVFPRTFPRGLDVEAFTAKALAQAWREAYEPHQREHVTPFFYEHPERFRLAAVRGKADHSRYRWTLDTAEDFELLQTIYDRLENRDDFNWCEALQLVQAEPGLAELNSHVVQKALHAV